MPIYEYRCLKCKYKFKKWQGFDHPPLTRCPRCEGKVMRIIQPAPFIFRESYKKEAPD